MLCGTAAETQGRRGGRADQRRMPRRQVRLRTQIGFAFQSTPTFALTLVHTSPTLSRAAPEHTTALELCLGRLVPANVPRPRRKPATPPPPPVDRRVIQAHVAEEVADSLDREAPALARPLHMVHHPDTPHTWQLHLTLAFEQRIVPRC